MRYANHFYVANFLPSRRRDCLTSALCPTPTLPKPHYPLLCTITLASPRKRGGGTAVEVFRLAVQYSDSPAFTILKLFRAVTVGIVNALEAFMIALLSISISFTLRQPFPKPHYPLALHYHTCLLVKGGGLNGTTQTLILLLSALRYANHFYVANFLPSRRRDCLTSAPLPPHQPFQNHFFSLLCTITLASPRKGRWHNCRGFSTCSYSIQIVLLLRF